MSNRARALLGRPVLTQDWEDEIEEGAAKYWELFLDLLLVAAASSITDKFRNNLTLEGFFEYALFYFLIMNAWHFYTHAYCTRFEDVSLSHSMVLFLYFLGFGCCIVNASYEDARMFVAGALLQRLSVLCMFAAAAYCIPRARQTVVWFTAFASVSCTALLVALIPGWTAIGLWAATILETFLEGMVALGLIKTGLLEMRQFIPINIEQTKDRMGALMLIMLGETVLSITIIYNEMKEKGEIFEDEESWSYYILLALVFLSIFMFALLYFNVQPTPSEHAYRRSVLHSAGITLVYKLQGLSFLSIGVCVKWAVPAVLQDDMTDKTFINALSCLAASSALGLILISRLLHYAGKTSFRFADYTIKLGEDSHLDRLSMLWWSTLAVACIMPPIVVYSSWTPSDPMHLIGIVSALLFCLTFLESYYVELMKERLANNNLGHGGETQGLILGDSSREKSYQTAK